ncbi:hypothetical protein [Microbulbifer discodermiae]|uniref:hypothetical protein n=1 Tax=Microbulbifer sp. 2201CG32-9 TaxID=3232309 RepID=UPI00345C57BA
MLTSTTDCRIRYCLGFAAALMAMAGFPIEAQEPAGEPQIPASADSFNKRFAAAELVAEVQVNSVHRDIDHALSEPGMVAVLGYVYSAVSQRVWKGRAGELIAFRLGLTDCDKKLVQGHRYLIFASADSMGRLQLKSCDAAVPGDKAGPLLALLREGEGRG